MSQRSSVALPDSAAMHMNSACPFPGKADLAKLSSLYLHAVDYAVRMIDTYVAQFVCRSVMMFWARRGRASLTEPVLQRLPGQAWRYS